MDIFDLGSALFGRSRAESDTIETNATTHTYVGTATSDSADGSVYVELSEDVTMPDEYDGEHGMGVEMPTVPGVSEGDEVLVTVFGGGVMKSPVVTGNAGEGDRQNAAIAAARGVADAAQAVADAINQHFFADTNGIHVTEATQEDWDESHTGANVLINSIGQLFRDGLNNLLTLTTESGARALTIWDGLGNSASNILARFSSDGISFADGTSFDIGDSSSYIHFDGNGHINIGGSGLTIGGYIPTGGVTVNDLTANAQSATLNSNISVGGRNLLPMSNRLGASGTSSHGLSWSFGDDGWIALSGTIDTTSSFAPVFWGHTVSESAPDYTWPAGTYTFTLETTGTPLVYGLVRVQVYVESGASQYLDGAGTVTFTATNGIQRIGLYVNANADGETVNGALRYKLEKGNMSTAWTPAPEDTPDQMTWYGTCSTEAASAAKVVACSGFELKTGARIAVKFATANTANAPTLNVNGTGAIATWYNNAVSSSNNPIRWGANATLNFVYDGSEWVLDERPPSYSATCSTAAGTRAKAPSVVGALVVNGTRLSVRFSTANTYTANSVQINLASTGAYSIYQNNAVTSTTNTLLWDANTILTFVAQGVYWHLLSRSDASKTATSYVTEITGQNGIMVHPSTDDDTGVQITSDVDILRDGNSVLNVGTQGDTSGNTDAGVTIYDGTANKNMVARFDSDEVSLGANSNSSTIDMCGGVFTFEVDNSTPSRPMASVRVNASSGSGVTTIPTLRLTAGTGTDQYGFDIAGIGSAQYPISVVAGGGKVVNMGGLGLQTYAIDLAGIGGGGTFNAYDGIYMVTQTGTNFWSTVPGTILWSSSGHMMTSSHTASLAYNVSTCHSGIVLHFQPYTSNTTRNYFHQYCFVPKTTVTENAGAVHNFTLCNNGFANVGMKALRIYDNQIVGDDVNDDTGTASGITFANNYWVMTQVIAV